YGAGSEVSNFHAVHPVSNRLYVAATAPDAADGEDDGISANGALYALDWRLRGHNYEMIYTGMFTFDGGTGSTPSVSADGKRVYVADDDGNIFALDESLDKVWELDVGEQVAASIAVAADNAELYAVTRRDIIKLFDRGDRAELAWRADLQAFPDHDNVNALTPTITANGLAVSIGASRDLGNNSLLMKAGFGLLDRETGALRGFVESPEESISVTVVDRDGGFTIAHSPVRRLGSVALFGDRLPPVRGGVTKFRSADDRLLAREAACSAAAFARRRQALPAAATAEAAQDDAQVAALLAQARRALARAGAEGLAESDDAAALCAALGD
ncbi:MAG: PQQ-binding-like beta-propeller repeat protein, partial [Halioglobus sp.]|nr:PQQ-binding-like beta-propeller repeat protein [Halioglobus sp.]